MADQAFAKFECDILDSTYVLTSSRGMDDKMIIMDTIITGW